MEHGNLSITLTLNAGECRIRRVRVFSTFSAKDQACRDADKFLTANSELARMQLDMVWQPESSRMTFDDIKEAAGKIARVRS